MSEWLNYHHLRYLWVVAKENNLAPPRQPNLRVQREGTVGRATHNQPVHDELAQLSLMV